MSTINGREGTGSHLVTVPPSPHLADALMTSPIIQVSCLHIIEFSILISTISFKKKLFFIKPKFV